jgi:hypothetical protein
MFDAKFSPCLLLSLVTQLLLYLAHLLVIVKLEGMKKRVREKCENTSLGFGYDGVRRLGGGGRVFRRLKIYPSNISP